MKQGESKQQQPQIPGVTTLVLVPTETLELILAQQSEILAFVKNQAGQSLSGYISEAEAMQLIGRKATWFWSQRKAGKLKYHNVGKKIFYSRAGIVALIEAGAVARFDVKQR